MNTTRNVRIALMVTSLLSLAACTPFATRTPTPIPLPLLQTTAARWARADQDATATAQAIQNPTRSPAVQTVTRIAPTSAATAPPVTPVAPFLRQAYVVQVPKGIILSSNAGPVVASTGPASTVTLWDVATGKEIARLKESSDEVGRIIRENWGGNIALSSDRRLLATLGNYVVTLWDVASGVKKSTLEMHYSKSNINATDVVLFSPDGRIVAATSNDDTFTLWDASSGKVIRTIEAGDWARDLAFSPDGKIIAAGLNWSGRIALWDVATGKEISIQNTHGSEVFTVAFAPDGRTVASGGTNGLVKLWDLASGQEIRSLGEELRDRGTQSDYWINALVFLSDGRYLASETFDHTVKLWDVALGRQVTSFPKFAIAARRYLYSRDDTGTERLWDLDVPALNSLPTVAALPTFTPVPTLTPTPQMTWTTFRSKSGGYSVTYPSEWEVTENPRYYQAPEGGQVVVIDYDTMREGWGVDVGMVITSWPVATKTAFELAQDFINLHEQPRPALKYSFKKITETKFGGIAGARVEFSLVGQTRGLLRADFVGSYTVAVRGGKAVAVEIRTIAATGGDNIPGLESRQQIIERIVASFTLE